MVVWPFVRDELTTLEVYRAMQTTCIKLQMDQAWQQTQTKTAVELMQTLETMLQPSLGGSSTIKVYYVGEQAQAWLAFGEKWSVTLSDALLTTVDRMARGEGGTVRF